MPRLPPFDPVEYLVDRKHPKVWGRARSAVEDQAREAYTAELMALPPEELVRLYKIVKGKQERARLDMAEKEENNRFFNLPSATADFEHWSRASYWTLEEATALAFGRDPKVVTSKTLELYDRVSPFAGRYKRLLDLAQRAKWAGQLWDPCYPSIYLAWADRMEIAVDERIVAAVKARGIQIADWKTAYDGVKAENEHLKTWCEAERLKLAEVENELAQKSVQADSLATQLAEALCKLQDLEADTSSRNATATDAGDGGLKTRERDSLLRMIIGMAVRGYAYAPTAARSSVTADIASDLATSGVPLDDDTVRKWLREAAQLLPQTE